MYTPASQRASEHQWTREHTTVARATANARVSIESLAHALRAYWLCHEPFTLRWDFHPPRSVSAPRGRPSGAGFALHSPKPNRPGITLRPRREGKSAWAESNFSVTRRCCTSLGNSSQLPKKAAPDWSHLLVGRAYKRTSNSRCSALSRCREGYRMRSNDFSVRC